MARRKLTREELIDIMREMLSGTCSEDRMGLLSTTFEQNIPHPSWTDLMYYPPSSTKMRAPEEIVDLVLAYTPVKVEHPLFDRLMSVAKKAASELFPGQHYRYVFDPVGLNFSAIRKSAYWCDPENSAEFITTGGDGHHYCFLVTDDAVREDSPILLCRPDYFGEPNVVVGENLHDFLCFGMHCGYFSILNVLAYPDDKAGEWFGDELSDAQRQLLKLLRDEFDLKPWTNRRQRFKELQERFLPMFKMPPDVE